MSSAPLVVLDTETYLMRPGRMAPRVVCVAIRYPEDGRSSLVRPDDPAIPRLLRAVAEEKYTLCGHHLAYDMACLGATRPDLIPTIFDIYTRFHAIDTIVLYKLWLLRRGLLLLHLPIPPQPHRTPSG